MNKKDIDSANKKFLDKINETLNKRFEKGFLTYGDVREAMGLPLEDIPLSKRGRLIYGYKRVIKCVDTETIKHRMLVYFKDKEFITKQDIISYFDYDYPVRYEVVEGETK